MFGIWVVVSIGADGVGVHEGFQSFIFLLMVTLGDKDSCCLELSASITLERVSGCLEMSISLVISIDVGSQLTMYLAIHGF